MTIRQIKGNAREVLLPSLGLPVAVTVLATVFKNFILLLASLPIAATGTAAFITYEFAFFVSSLLIALAEVGICKFYLTLSTKRRTSSLTDLVYGFRNAPDRTVMVALTLTIIEAVCMSPYVIYSCFFMPAVTQQNMYLLLLFTSVISLVCELLCFLFTIPFALSYFIIIDMPELSPLKVLKMSCRLMRKRGFAYIGFCISFFPLMLVAFLSFGIGNLWLTPYMQAGFAEFYMDAVERHSKK